MSLLEPATSSTRSIVPTRMSMLSSTSSLIVGLTGAGVKAFGFIPRSSILHHQLDAVAGETRGRGSDRLAVRRHVDAFDDEQRPPGREVEACRLDGVGDGRGDARRVAAVVANPERGKRAGDRAGRLVDRSGVGRACRGQPSGAETE